MTEIAGQPDALRRAAAGLREQRGRLDEIGALAGSDGVVLTGMGGSYAACYPLASELASAGIPALMVGAAELVHFRAATLRRSTPIVAMSQSGESAEVVRLAELLRARAERPRLIAVTNGADSTLAGGADVVLDTRAGDERGPSTLTFAAGLVTLAAVGLALRGVESSRMLDEVSASAEAAAESIERLLGDETLDEALSAWLGSRDEVVVLGRGPARAAAEMGALTLKEAAALPAEALEAGQFRHGPLELAGPGLAAIVVATEPETASLDWALADELAADGVAVLEVGRVPRPATDTGPRVVAIGDLHRSVAPAASIVPIQRLAHRLAVGLGREPGITLRAAKVTTRE